MLREYFVFIYVYNTQDITHATLRIEFYFFNKIHSNLLLLNGYTPGLEIAHTTSYVRDFYSSVTLVK